MRSGIANKWIAKFTLVLIQLYHSLHRVPNAFFCGYSVKFLLKMCYLITSTGFMYNARWVNENVIAPIS